MPSLYTIGHSTRTLDEFIALLKANKIACVVDVRSIPKSRKFPWFNKDKLEIALTKEKILYVHMQKLGGLRHAKKDSINQAWHNISFRGFADYMQTKEFYLALKALNNLIKDTRTVVMCAEAVPWRCHRSLIADAEYIRNIKVLHIIKNNYLLKHQLTVFAEVNRKRKPLQVYYP